MKNKRSLFDRFMKNVYCPNDDYETPFTECWIWTGGKTKFGYGLMRDENGKTCPAHRIAFRLFVFDFRQDLCVLHTCDNPSCVNPNHLFLGTHADNMRDMWNKKRHSMENMGRPSATMIGENNINSKLTKENVLEIRSLYENGTSQTELSLVFGVKLPAIWKIVHRHTWKHI